MLRKMMALLSILTFLTTSISLRAEEVITIKAGTPAPFSGFLFPPEQAKDAYSASLERDRLKLINESFVRSIDLYKSNEQINNEKIKLLMDRNDVLSKELMSNREVTTVEKIGLFVLGMAAMYGAYQVAK